MACECEGKKMKAAVPRKGMSEQELSVFASTVVKGKKPKKARRMPWDSDKDERRSGRDTDRDGK